MPHFLCYTDFINSFVQRYLDLMCCYTGREYWHLRSYLTIVKHSAESMGSVLHQIWVQALILQAY